MDQLTLPTTKQALATSIVCFVLYEIASRIILALRRRALAREKGCKPPLVFNTSSRFWGVDRLFGLNISNYLDLVDDFKAHRYLPGRSQQFRRHFPTKTFVTRLLHLDWHFTNEAENVKFMQSTDFANWVFPPGRKHGLGQMLGRGIFTTDGAEWQHSRELLRPNFTRFHVSNISLFERHFHHLLAKIPSDGSTVDLSTLFFRLTMDTATEFLFGQSADTQQNGEGQEFSDAFARAQGHMLTLFRLGKMAKYVPTAKAFANDREVVYAFVDKYVALALSQHKRNGDLKRDEEVTGKYVFVEELVTRTTDPIQLRSELLATLLAGRDTTASLLTNLWFTLSLRPDVWEKLQAEVATLNGEHPSFERLKELKYLQAIMSESLRLHPPVPLNSRVAVTDSVLPRGGGLNGASPLFIKKGDIVVWNLYAYHRQKDVWGEDVEEFRPERWIGQGAARPGWHYLPFNAGPRVCLGQQFALTEAGYTTVRLCQTFQGIEARGEESEWKETLGLVMTNLTGAKVGLTPRE